MRVEAQPGRWERVDPYAVYNITTVDYIAKGGDGFTILAASGELVVNTNAFAFDVLLAELDLSLAAPLNVTIDARIAETNLSRRACLPIDGGAACHGNGYCLAGACVCTAPGASGVLCDVAPSASPPGNGGGLS